MLTTKAFIVREWAKNGSKLLLKNERDLTLARSSTTTRIVAGEDLMYNHTAKRTVTHSHARLNTGNRKMIV